MLKDLGIQSLGQLVRTESASPSSAVASSHTNATVCQCSNARSQAELHSSESEGILNVRKNFHREISAVPETATESKSDQITLLIRLRFQQLQCVFSKITRL